MRKIGFVLVLLLAPTPVAAQDSPAVSFEQLTVGTSAVSLAASTVNPSGKPAALYCRGLVEDADLRARVDGTAPTSTVGALAQAGAVVELTGADSIRLFSAIRTSGTSAVLALTCFGTAPAAWRGSLAVTPPPQGVNTTGSGAEVHAVSPTLTTPTLTTPTITDPTITGATVTTATIGRGTTHTSFRQEFTGPCFKAEAADFTAELVTNAGVNLAVCQGGISNFEYRLDGDQASPFIVSGGSLDIDNTGIDDEGVEIVVADTSASTQGWVVVGTSPAMYVRASITIASVSGTDNFYFGWKLAAAFVDNLVLGTIDTYGVIKINDTAGNIQIATGADGTDAVDEAAPNATWADAETIVLEVRVSAAGVFSFYMDDVLQTVTLASGAADAGDILVPVIGLLNAADADTELKVNWIEIGAV